MPRSKKRKKYDQIVSLFALLGSAWVKAAHKHADEIDPRYQYRQQSVPKFFS